MSISLDLVNIRAWGVFSMTFVFFLVIDRVGIDDSCANPVIPLSLMIID